MNNREHDEVIYDAVALWGKIKKSAAFNDTDYDKALLEEMKSYLHIDMNADFANELKNISVEEFLNALFKSIKPFSEMLGELLEVFSRAGAKYTDKNLKIAVDFGELKVDLENFRTDVETISEIIHNEVKTYLIEDPWKLRNLFEFDGNSNWAGDAADILNNEIRDWAVSYNNRKLPPFFPKQPKFSEEVDSRIRVIWDNLYSRYEMIKSAYKEEAGIRESVCEQTRLLRQQLNNEASDEVKHELLPKFNVFQAESDCYICTMIVSITKFVEFLCALDVNERGLLIENFKREFDCVFSNFNSVTREEIDRKITHINSFLNLPYWQHRYEVYSAWVFTLIAKAFGYSNLKYELVNNNTLSFSFGGSHLATYDPGESLEIWAECRSPAISKVKGTGRVRGIQPDYTIAHKDAKNPSSAIAVVECKQYKNSNTGNFSKAIIDYANNRPNAKIFLVNYGPIGNAVNKKVLDDGIAECRFATFGNVRPQNSGSFVNALRSYLFEPMTITLKWGERPVDLDLMLNVIDLNTMDSQNISYKEKGVEERPPYAVLNDDCITGFGPEIITVFRVDSRKKYSVNVNKYSNENEVVGEITIKVECKAFKKEYIKKEIFNTWNVCTMENGQIITTDTIE